MRVCGAVLGAVVLAATSLVATTGPAGAVRAASSAQLVPVASVPGTIMDVSPTAILWWQDDTLFVRDRTTGTDTQLPSLFWNASAFTALARLTPTGVLAEVGGGATFEMEEWRNGHAVDRGPVPYPHTRIAVAGAYSLWSSGSTTSAVAEWHDTSRAGVQSSGTAVDPGGADDVAANGLAVYSSATGDLLTFNGRREISLRKHGAGPGFWMPLTDGTNFVYAHGPACCAQRQRGSIVLQTPTGTVALTGVIKRGPSADVDYQIASGWIAYRSDDNDGLHVRSPAGDDSVVSSLNAHLLALGDSGQVVYRQGRSRFDIASPGAAPIRIPVDYPIYPSYERGDGSTVAVFMAGSWYVVHQGTIYRLDL